MNMNIHTNDTVVVLQGKDKGKKGKVVKVLPKKGKLVVEGLNVVKKHMKSRKPGQSGQLIELSQPLPYSRVQLFCDKCGKSTRFSFVVSGDKKARVCSRCKSDV